MRFKLSSLQHSTVSIFLTFCLDTKRSFAKVRKKKFALTFRNFFLVSFKREWHHLGLLDPRKRTVEKITFHYSPRCYIQYLVVTYLDNKFKNHSKLKVHKKYTKYILHNRDTSSIPTQCQFKTSCHCPCTILCHCRFKWIIILCELQRHGSCTPMDYEGKV